MKYADFRNASKFGFEELLAFAHGSLIEDPPEGLTARLPLPPMLMVDRVEEIRRTGTGGRVVAERDVRLDDWFFQCHFLGDPVQPGALGVDAVWQLVGFFCVWAGAVGGGRALGCGEIDFEGQIRPHDGTVRYELDVRRYAELAASGSAVAVADARVLVDGDLIYTMKRMKAGVFKDIAYPGYPFAGPGSRGGRLER